MHPANPSSPWTAVFPSLSAAQESHAADTTPKKSWGRRELTYGALALGGVAIAACQNYHTSNSVYRSLFSYVMWQLPAALYYLGTEPINQAKHISEFARQQQNDVQRELGIPESQGICGAVSAVWLITLLNAKSNSTLIHVMDACEHDQLKVSTELIYPRDESGNYAFSFDGFRQFLAMHGLKRADQFVISEVLASRLQQKDGSAVDEKALHQELMDRKHLMQELNMELVQSAPLDKLTIGDSFACIMASKASDENHKEAQEEVRGDHSRSHVIIVSRTGDGLVIFDPEVGVPMVMKSDDDCRVQLEKLESIHQKKIYHFLRYPRIDSDDLKVV